MTDKKSVLDSEAQKQEKRRKALKSILAGSGAVVTATVLQDKWSRPVVESILLPAHAQTSQALAVSFAVSGIASLDNNELLDFFVPTAHAGVSIRTTTTTTTAAPTTAALPATKNVCINIVGASAAVQVTIQGGSALFSGNLALPFADTSLTATPASSVVVSISGSISAGGDSITGVIMVDGVATTYTAPKSSVTCQLGVL